MVKTTRKYKGTLTLGKLEIALEANEALFGGISKLEALGGYTIATFDEANDFPAQDSLALLPLIAGKTPQTPKNSEHILDGAATILTAEMGIAVFRTA